MDKELRKVNRAGLIDIIYALEQRVDELEKEGATLREQLESRSIAVRDAGSIAEASLALNGVFEAAQRAADQYLASCEELRRQSEGGMADVQKDAQAQADQLLNAAREEAESLLGQARAEVESLRSGAQAVAEKAAGDVMADAQKRAAQIVADARSQSAQILADAQARADVILVEAEGVLAEVDEYYIQNISEEQEAML